MVAQVMAAPVGADEIARIARVRVEGEAAARRARRARLLRGLRRGAAGAPRPAPPRAAALSLACALACAAILLALPAPARAEGFFDGIKDAFGAIGDFASDPLAAVSNAINSIAIAWMQGICRTFLEEGYTILSRVKLSMSSDFTNLLGSGTGLYGLVHTAETVIIQPIAISVFGVVMLLRLIDIAGKFDGSNAMPGLREIFMFGCFVFLFETLILNAEGMFWGIFQICQGAADRLIGTYDASLGDIGSVTFAFDSGSVPDVGSMVLMTLMSVVFCGTAMIASWIASLKVLARGVQIYVMTALSPLGFALLGSDSTRQMGIGFLRNFTAVCLDGFTIAFIILAFPLALTSMASTGSVLIVDATDLFTKVSGVTTLSFLLLWSLLHSSQWTRQVLGG